MALFLRPRSAAFLPLCAASLAFVASASAASAADITVVLDQAKLVKLPERVATLVIGNPLIADASIQAGGLVVITGKGYGNTNFIALDRSGAVLLEQTVEVKGPRAHTIVVYRGVNRETHSCTPICEPSITLGDAQTYFENNLGQSVVRSGIAQGNPPAAK